MRRLRDAHFACGSRDVAFLEQRVERGQQVQVDGTDICVSHSPRLASFDHELDDDSLLDRDSTSVGESTRWASRGSMAIRKPRAPPLM